MKLEECCGATNAEGECASTNAGGECCGATNALWANLFEECRWRMLRSNECPKDECLWRMLRSNECALHESLRLHVRLKQDNTWKT